MTAFAAYQDELYDQGLHGRQPPYPISFAELEEKASAAMTPTVWQYVAGGAGDEHTQRANCAAFQRWGLCPRMLVAPTERDMSVDLFGMRLPSPVFMAPVGVIGVCAQDGHGDLACARASARTGVPFFAGTLSADPMEDVAAELGDTPGFFQLYAPPDREMAASLVHRAEAAGFRGIAVTLDTWVTGWRPRDLSGSNYPQVPSGCLSNYTSDPVFKRRLKPGEDPTETVVRTLPIFGGPFRWEDLDWLRSQTKLPLMLKGICHPDDVRRAKDHGADAIYCSNHGGRQANGGLTALECLPDVLDAADELPVLFDSGVRTGADVIKAHPQGPHARGTALREVSARCTTLLPSVRRESRHRDLQVLRRRPGRSLTGRGWTAGHRVAENPTSGSEEAEHDEGRSVMARIVERIKQFARSPQGRRTIEQARRTAADPRRRAQARELVRKLRGRR